MTTRRQRNRQATVEEIKQAALEQIATLGGAAVTIRGVARAIGMSPAGLYRYYEGLDQLLTELITDAYTDLARAVEAAVSRGGTTRHRFSTGMIAYRDWALGQPNRFLLIFGTPIPGYAAPEGGPTVEANRRIGTAFFRVAADGWQRGELKQVPLTRPVVAGERELAQLIGQDAPGFPPELVAPLLGTWAHFHGLVGLEVLGQLHWLYPDPDTFFRGELDRILDGLLV